MNCLNCGRNEIIKNGSLANGKPKHQRKRCGCQFVQNLKKSQISEDMKALIKIIKGEPHEIFYSHPFSHLHSS